MSAEADHDQLLIRGGYPADWAPTVEIFRNCVAMGGPDSGGAMALYVAGEEVFSVAAGEDGAGNEWTEDTRAVGWSCTKGVIALGIQLLAERGEIDVAAPVSDYWPEFSGGGKEDIQIRHVLTHTSALPFWDGFQEITALGETDGWDRTRDILAALEQTAVQWAPGAHMAYHAFTFGWILGEVISRITGQDIGEFIRQNIAEPLDAGISVGTDKPGDPVAVVLPPKVVAPPSFMPTFDFQNSPQTIRGRSLFIAGPRAMYEVHTTANSPVFLRSMTAAANGLMSAKGLARMYGALANGGRLGSVELTSPTAIARHSENIVSLPDLVNFGINRYALGYNKPGPLNFLGPNEAAFGHAGLGGQLGFADPVTGFGFAFMSNRPLIADCFDPRLSALVASLYARL